jgi:hypothetical protein
LAQATPGKEANAAPRRAPPIHLIALPRERVPVASPLANSSKEVVTLLGLGFVSSCMLGCSRSGICFLPALYLKFAPLFVLICAVERFGLEVLYSVSGFFDLLGDEI